MTTCYVKRGAHCDEPTQNYLRLAVPLSSMELSASVRSCFSFTAHNFTVWFSLTALINFASFSNRHVSSVTSC